jgi:uncharacterized protein (TIGR02246 family)
MRDPKRGTIWTLTKPGGIVTIKLNRHMPLALRRRRMFLAAALAALLCAPAPALALDCSSALTDDDAAKVRGVVEAYRTAWLRGDSEGVMKTLTDDAVLLPAHGARPIVGREAIVKYWWPAGGPPSKVTRLDITVEGLTGDCATAYSHGRDDVAWTQDENGVTRTHGHPGTYLNVYRKLADGSWRIARHMWDDGPAGK